MIIKNLWIISKIGLCHYHYQAEFSDYQIEELLFAGLVAGLANFAESLSSDNQSVEYLKLGTDELYFETIGEIIVAAILAGGTEKLQPFSVKLMLQFIGTKFSEKYLNTMQDLLFDWSLETNYFTREINGFLTDKDLLEDIKREQFQNMFMNAMEGNIPIEELYWRGMQLFADTTPEVLKRSIRKISSLEDVISSVTQDEILEGKLHDVLFRLLKDLRSNALNLNHKKLLVLSQSEQAFEKLRRILQSRDIRTYLCVDYDGLQKNIDTWNKSDPYDILVIQSNLTAQNIRTLHSLRLNGNTKILAVVNRISRLPKGRIAQKKSISYIIQEDIDTINRDSPFIEYLLTSLVHE
ncbi:MAG: hypothetical protein ACW97Z_02605 [Candidatus Hodarchaeales archaeon]|jgi:hypothetical protein